MKAVKDFLKARNIYENTQIANMEAPENYVKLIDLMEEYANQFKQVSQETVDAIKELLQLAKVAHTYCEDSWYSCPKAEDGCANDCYNEDECICGADRQNERVKELGIILMNDSRLSL